MQKEKRCWLLLSRVGQKSRCWGVFVVTKISYFKRFTLVRWFATSVPLSRDKKENHVEGSDLFSVVEFN